MATTYDDHDMGAAAWADAPRGNATRLVITVTSRDSCPVVTAIGEIDLATVDSLNATLEQEIAPDRKVVADLAETTFVDSNGLRAMLVASMRARDGGGVLVIVPGRALAFVADLAGVTEYLNLAPDLETALRA
jgi:anti-anti-sigma factor